MGEIVSSTGDLGIELRSYNRIYLNWRWEPITQAATIEGYFERLSHFGRFERDGIVVEPEGRRDVFRGLANGDVVRDLLANNNLSGAQVEAAFPLPGREDLWYLYVARNDSARTPALTPVPEMYRRVRENIRSFNPPLETIAKVLQEEHTFVTTLDPDDLETQRDLLQLWEETFEWDTRQIGNFARRLSLEDPNNRSAWFSGIRNRNGQLISASMAELIVFKGRNGEDVRIVESTEWSSQESDHIKASLDLLHTQIFESYPDAIIIAECNFHRGAHRAAQKSGMMSPDVVVNGQIIQQANIQNVFVGDGNPPPGLRDFILFMLSQERIPQRERRQILQLVA